MQILDDKQSRLLDTVRGYESCAVAFSGGVDSAVVCQAAALALGDRAVAITGSSNSLAAGERESARELARQIGIRHEVIETAEFQQADYTRNAADRCFHCKTELYGQMRRVAERLGLRTLANGANLDDLGDYRPGLKAAADFNVQSPLADCGFMKADVRALARRWELPVWNKPAAPCLSSRVAYGQQVTPERLAMIDVAERFLRRHGFATVRVRYHAGDVARLEVPLADVPRLAAEPLRSELVDRLKTIGFRFIALDLEGFRSGNLNQLVSLEGFVEKPPGN
jgi:uncharacterized protein